MKKGFVFWSGVVSGGLTLIQDLVLYKTGKIDNRQLAVHTTRNLTETAGSVAGIEYGAIIGTSLLPGAGTIIGSVVGYAIGSRLGSAVGTRTGKILFPDQEKRQLEYNERFFLEDSTQ